MRNKAFVLISYSLLFAISLSGQCPDRDSLWRRIIFLKESSNISTDERLQSFLKEEEKLKSCPDRNDSAYAFLLQRIGTTYYQLYDYLKAVKYCNRAIDMIRSNIGNAAINPKHLIINYYILAVVYDSLNRVTEKIACLDSCFSLGIRLNSVDLYCMSALYKIVEFFYDVGDYQNCIDYATKCESLAKQYAMHGEAAYQRGLEYASSSVAWKVNSLLMLENYNDAEKLLTDKIEESKTTKFQYNIGSINAQLARVEQHKGNYEKALSYLNKAFHYEQGVGNNISCKTILNNIGYDIYFKHYNDSDKALFYFRRGLSFTSKKTTESSLDSIESLNILANIANVYVKKGLYDSAFKYFQLAFDQLKPGVDESGILHSSLNEFARQKKIGYLTHLFIDKGDAFFQQYKTTKQTNALTEAIRIYKLTDQLLNKIKNEQSDLQSKLFWRTDSKLLYEHAIDACYNNNDISDAFYFFEKSRAVLLNDQLNEQHWMGEADILKQTQLKKKISQLERDLAGADKNAAHLEELRNQLFTEKQQLDHLIQVIRIQNPLYYQNFVDTAITTLQDVQKRILTDHQALVEIFAGDSAVYALIITRENYGLNKINKPIFDSLSRLYISHISNPETLNKNFNSFTKCSHGLYEIIFKDIVLPHGRIIISPDGQYFPFEALVVNGGGRTPDYFLNNYSVSYTYSARYTIGRFATNERKTNFLGIAPVEYPASMQLASLIGSDHSLSRLQSHFADANNLISKDATKLNFLNQFYKYKIIQLYTHASSTSKYGEPVIYFSDSAMYLSDIISENKPIADLIVLAACETGNGKLYPGEGVFSLNRAFAAAGIPSSITNLWAVDNESMYKLTELFYKRMAEGEPTDIALQQAKIEFARASSKEKQMPYFWAASILVGTNEAIVFNKSNPWKDLLIISIAIVLTWLLVYQIFSKKKKLK